MEHFCAHSFQKVAISQKLNPPPDLQSVDKTFLDYMLKIMNRLS